MTLLEFVNKHIGKKVDFDGYYGPQCVDLYRQYCQDVWEIPHTGSVEGAKDLVEKYYILPRERKYLVLCKAPESAKSGDGVPLRRTNTAMSRLSSLRMRACCLCSSRTDSRRTAQSSHGARKTTL